MVHRPLALLQGGGAVLAAREIEAVDGIEALCKLEPALQRLHAARPTAVSLARVLARMRRTLGAAHADWRQVMECEAESIARRTSPPTVAAGTHGAALIPIGSGVLTHYHYRFFGDCRVRDCTWESSVMASPKGASHAYS